MEATKIMGKNNFILCKEQEQNTFRRTISNQTLELLNGFSYIQRLLHGRLQENKLPKFPHCQQNG